MVDFDQSFKMLNIKNPETYRLARELADRTGETLTGAVTEALRERLRRIPTRSRPVTTVEEILEIGRRCASHLKGPAISHEELLYDEHGLPK